MSWLTIPRTLRAIDAMCSNHFGHTWLNAPDKQRDRLAFQARGALAAANSLAGRVFTHPYVHARYACGAYVQSLLCPSALRVGALALGCGAALVAELARARPSRR